MSSGFDPVVEVPVVETERLTLRRHRLEDFNACATMWADPKVTRYIGGRAYSGEETWARMLRYVGHWSLLGFGYWALEERASGSFIGELGFANFKREIDPALADLPELGWALASHAHGKGYATEAVRAAIAWGDTRFQPAQQTLCLIHPENMPSTRVAEKCGFELLQRTLYKGQPSLVFNRFGK